MKKKSILLVTLFFSGFFCFSQDVIRLQSCQDALISKQVDSLKNIYGKEGLYTAERSFYHHGKRI